MNDVNVFRLRHHNGGERPLKLDSFTDIFRKLHSNTKVRDGENAARIRGSDVNEMNVFERQSPSRLLGDATLQSETSWDLEVFYDGDCPLCRREVNWVRGRDRQRRIRWIDIADPAFDAGRLGTTQEALMSQLHGRLPNGRWLTGVEVFRRMYQAAGFGWLVAITRLPGLSHALGAAYRLFARNRLRLTGRCHPDGGCELLPAASANSRPPLAAKPGERSS